MPAAATAITSAKPTAAGRSPNVVQTQLKEPAVSCRKACAATTAKPAAISAAVAPGRNASRARFTGRHSIHIAASIPTAKNPM